MRRGLFVFCVCGDAHVARVDLALRFLKRFSRADAVVVVARSTYPLSHDQILAAAVPAGLNNHQASIYLKTMLPQLVGTGAVCCYLDSDQIATSERVDDVFEFYQPPIMFAPDASTLDQFSRYAVNCSCRSGACGHLREAIRARFGIDIPDGQTHHWNGGLYLFDRASTDFAQRWHGNALLSFDDAYWRIRDQGTLLVTQWQFGLQEHPLIPKNATRIVDRFFGYGEAVRDSLRPDQFFVDRSYELRGPDSSSFLHFINDGAGHAGWPMWDRVEALLVNSDEGTALAGG